MQQWIPKYLRWYRFAYGPKLSLDEVIRRSMTISAENDGDMGRMQGA
jgi:hypothetical protein